MTYEEIKSLIDSYIIPGVSKGVTAEKINELYHQLLDFSHQTAGDFQGSAAPTDNPGTPSSPVYYTASVAGTYANFGGIVVSSADMAAGWVQLVYNGSSWGKTVVAIDLTGYALKTEVDAGFSEMQASVDFASDGIKAITYPAGIVNLGTLIPDNRILTSNGAVFGPLNGGAVQAGWVMTDFITVSPAQLLRYSGDQVSATTGTCFYDENFIFVSAAVVDTVTYPGDTIDDFTFPVPSRAKYLRSCSYIVLDPVFEIKQINYILKDEQTIEAGQDFTVDSINKSVFVSPSGLDTNAGTFAKPVKTINKAIDLIKKTGGIIIVKEGDYRETLNLLGIEKGTVSILRYAFDKVRVLGSDLITGWIKTPSRNKIYEATFTGTIDFIGNNASYGKRVFDDGVPSNPIPEAEFEPLQKGQTHRLPYSEVKLIPDQGSLSASLDYLDSLTGSNSGYYLDGTKMYLVNSTKTLPTNINYAARLNTNSIVENGTLKFGISVFIAGIHFCYSSGIGLSLYSFSKIKLFDVSVFGARLTGLNTQGSYVEGTLVESGGCGTDGVASQLYFPPPNLSREKQVFDFWRSVWCHDNYDDGFSLHQNGSADVAEFLFEYNIDTGIQQVGSSYTLLSNGLARNNGKGVVSNGGAVSSHDRIATTFNCVNVKSTNNARNFESVSDATTRISVMRLLRCVSKDGSTNGYRASGTAVLIAEDCTSDRDITPTFGPVIVINNSILV